MVRDMLHSAESAVLCVKQRMGKNYLGGIIAVHTYRTDDIRDLSLMRENGAFFSMMTGSGPTVFGLFKDKKTADTAATVLREKTKEVFVVKM